MTEHVGPDGTIRKDHYGSGKQPWDDIKEAGWGPAFAAGNVLKYVRRDKAKEHSLQSAMWYWTELKKMDKSTYANGIKHQLVGLLTKEERLMLGIKLK